MARKKTTAETDDAKSYEQASVIAEVLVATCLLLDEILTDAETPINVGRLFPVVSRMEAYLEKRERANMEPMWVARMRRTVNRFRVRLKLTRAAPPNCELH